MHNITIKYLKTATSTKTINACNNRF